MPIGSIDSRFVAAEFDEHARGYEEAVESAIAFAGQEQEFYTRAKAALLLEIARRRLGDPSRLSVLDVGCGPGLIENLSSSCWGSVHGVDTSSRMVDLARQADPSGHYRTYDGARLPYPDESHDLTFAICVLHHVEPPVRLHLVREMVRVTKSAGVMAVFEHNPLNPLTRRVVRNCVFDKGVELLPRSDLASLFRRAGLDVVEERYLLFFPSSRRWVNRVEHTLRRVPFGAQYVVVGARP